MPSDDERDYEVGYRARHQAALAASASRSEVIKGAAGSGMAGAAAGQGLPAANGGIDIAWIELEPAAAPARALGGDHRRAAAEKGVEHDVAARRAVEDRIGDHGDRLHRRVERQQITLLATAGKGIGPGITPHIAAVAPKPAELDIVAVRVRRAA